jgi:hypothetical protein
VIFELFVRGDGVGTLCLFSLFLSFIWLLWGAFSFVYLFAFFDVILSGLPASTAWTQKRNVLPGP